MIQDPWEGTPSLDEWKMSSTAHLTILGQRSSWLRGLTNQDFHFALMLYFAASHMILPAHPVATFAKTTGFGGVIETRLEARCRHFLDAMYSLDTADGAHQLCKHVLECQQPVLNDDWALVWPEAPGTKIPCSTFCALVDHTTLSVAIGAAQNCKIKWIR